MVRYAASATPWRVVALAACLVAGLMELVRWNPGELWPLEGTTVGLLAGASALCFDERAAAVIDAAPRSLGWRTAARAVGPCLLVLVWTATVLHLGSASLFDHRDQVMAQGWAAVVVGAAAATWARSGGADSPGISFLAGVVPLTTAWALVHPLARPIPLFPYADGRPPFSDWDASAVLWSGIGTAAVALLAAALADARWLPARVRSSRLDRPAPDMDQGPVRTRP